MLNASIITMLQLDLPQDCLSVVEAGLGLHGVHAVVTIDHGVPGAPISRVDVPEGDLGAPPAPATDPRVQTTEETLLWCIPDGVTIDVQLDAQRSSHAGCVPSDIFEVEAATFVALDPPDRIRRQPDGRPKRGPTEPRADPCVQEVIDDARLQASNMRHRSVAGTVPSRHHPTMTNRASP